MLGVIQESFSIQSTRALFSTLKEAYLKGKREKRTSEDNDLPVLPPKKCGSLILLGEDIKRKVQLYVEKVREEGGVVSEKTVVAAARGNNGMCQVKTGGVWWSYTIIQVLGIFTFGSHERHLVLGYHCQV